MRIELALLIATAALGVSAHQNVNLNVNESGLNARSSETPNFVQGALGSLTGQSGQQNDDEQVNGGSLTKRHGEHKSHDKKTEKHKGGWPGGMRPNSQDDSLEKRHGEHKSHHKQNKDKKQMKPRSNETPNIAESTLDTLTGAAANEKDSDTLEKRHGEHKSHHKKHKGKKDEQKGMKPRSVESPEDVEGQLSSLTGETEADGNDTSNGGDSGNDTTFEKRHGEHKKNKIMKGGMPEEKISNGGYNINGNGGYHKVSMKKRSGGIGGYNVNSKNSNYNAEDSPLGGLFTGMQQKPKSQ